MEDDAKNSIEVVVLQDANLSRGGPSLVTKHLDVEELQGRFSQFMSSLQSIVDVQPADSFPFHLSKVEFSAEITAAGEFKLLGTGVSVGGTNAIKFVLKRK